MTLVSQIIAVSFNVAENDQAGVNFFNHRGDHVL